MMRISFQEELDELEASLREEGELVLRSLRAAVEAVCTQDVELADEVIAFDDDVAFFWMREGIGRLVGHGPAGEIFGAPKDELTQAYVNGARG